MNLLVKLSGDETFLNPLSVLLDIVKLEISHFKLAMLSAHQLEDASFQVTGFCSEGYCPVYTAEEMLNTSPNFSVLQGDFIEAWKTKSSAQKISCDTCPDLFQGDLKYFGEAIVIPIWINSKINRWIVIVDYASGDSSEESFFIEQNIDIDKLSLLLNYALTNILRTEQKRQLDKARLWIDKELKEISRIQSLLLPQKELNITSVKIAFKFKAFKDVGGDYLDLFQLPSDDNNINWGGVIADVTGHGPSAAVEAAMLDAILRTFPRNNQSTPADVVSYVNKHFFTRQDRGKFITAKFFSYSSETKQLSYVSAGHPNGYIKRGKDVFVLDKSRGIPIGVLQDYQWDIQYFDMQVGDILFVYTDVVLETRNAENDEFGEHRLVQAISNAPNCPFKLVDIIEKTLLDFNNNRELMDDLTLSALMLEE